ncbi:MAG: DUF401 family protein [Deltaproteobacteria bacterium]|nr:DUF401 family protein [Deltaproteobacteria bacterium]
MNLVVFMPATILVFLVFGLVLLLIRFKMSLGNSFFLGAVLLGLVFGLKPSTLIASLIGSVLYPKTLALAAIVSLILVLSNSMEAANQLKRLLSSFRGLIASPKINLVIFPALIGFLPMPGGAIFSAPMVKEVAAEENLSAAELSYINYWFRHIWEYWWPLYPGILLGTALADLNLSLFIVTNIPLTAAALFLGYIPLRGRMQRKPKPSDEDRRPSFIPFLKELTPILIVIVPGLSIGAILGTMAPSLTIARETGLLISLVAAIAWTWRTNGLSVDEIARILKNPHIIKMIFMIVSILMFKGVLEKSNAVGLISDELQAMNVPLAAIAIILPLIVGFIVGITVAFVGTTFPIIIPLVHSYGEGAFMLPYIMLALVSGFAGVMASPLHFCFLLSNEYFRTSIVPVYRLLKIPLMAHMATGILYFWLLRTIMAL